MKGYTILAGSIMALLLSACASQPTPYMPRVGGFGYEETQLDSHTWRVVFAGNTNTPRETVENYLLYRAAEIMLFGGQEHFIVLEKEIERTLDYRSLGPYPYSYRHRGYGGRRPYAAWHGGYGRSSYIALESYQAFATIRSYPGGRAPADFQIYAARELIARLSRFVILPN